MNFFNLRDSDEELLHRLLEIPRNAMKGKGMREILKNLMDQSIKPEKVQIICEVAQRYSEKRLRTGESFSSASQIYEHFQLRLTEVKQEVFVVVLLDNKHRIIGEHLVSVGTINQSLVHPREVFSKAVELRAAAIILVHNHPSGDPLPSQQDIAITNRLKDVGEIVGIKVLDHLIIGDGRFISFNDEDMMS